LRLGDGRFDIGQRRFAHLADDVAQVRGVRTSAHEFELALPSPASASSGEARQSSRARFRAMRSPSARRLSSFARSSPCELVRCAPYSAAGSAIAGCGRPSVPPSCAPMRSTVATGSSTSTSSGIVGSAMRFTNEVLAPFSSRRRTR
jgi:hypothetical protein